MLCYTITVKCRYCQCPCPNVVIAEVEPPPDTKINLYCPSHGGPIPVLFRYFKRAEAIPPDTYPMYYPPKPEPPPDPKRSWNRW